MGAFISQVDSLPDSSALMNDFGVAFGGGLYFFGCSAYVLAF